MNLIFRLITLLIATAFRSKIAPPFGVSRLNFRVWPTDIDTNLHMNNGRYLTIADLGRTDLVLRSGLWTLVAKRGLLPMLSGASIRFRREMRTFQPFTLESRIIFWRDTAFVMEHRFLMPAKDGGEPILAAIALVRGGLYNRKARAFASVAEVLHHLGYDGPAPEGNATIEAFLATEEALKDYRG